MNMTMRATSLVLTILAIALICFDPKAIGSAAQPQSQQPRAGCHWIGSSACGGDDHGQCKPHEKYCGAQCNDGTTYNVCVEDDYCASVNKGRANIAGAWSGGYVFRQLGDSLSVTGGSAGPGNGAFVSAYQIRITWPQAHAAYIGTVSELNGVARRISWNNNTTWSR